MKGKKRLQTILSITGVILELIGLTIYFITKNSLSIIFFIGAIALIVSSLFILSNEEKQIEKIEMTDERNTMIRHMAHAQTNTIMVFIQGLIAILCSLFNYHTLAILFAGLVVLNGVIISILGYKIEKEM